MKKFKDFILSLIIPHRMVRFQNMSILVAILLLLIGVILSGFSNINRMRSYVAKTFKASDYSELVEEGVKLDEVEMTLSAQGVASFKLPKDSNGIFVKELTDKKGVKYHVTIVIDVIKKDNGEEVTEEDLEKERVLSNFDIQDYRNYYIANRSDNTVYLLYVLTETTIFHLYDLGQKVVDDKYVDDLSSIRYMTKTVVDEKANFFKKLTGRQSVSKVLYYQPAVESELKASIFDKSNNNYASSTWSKEVDENARDVEIGGVKYQATPKLGYRDASGKEYQTVNAILRVGYTYDKVEVDKFKATAITKSVVEFIQGFYDGTIYFDSEAYTFIISLISFFMFLFVPPFFSLFAWLFTKRTGMPKYKNYFNIMSIIQIPAALIMFFSGWFINLLDHLWIIIIALLMMIWYYIFVIYQINSKLSQNKDDDFDDKSSGEEPKKEAPKPVFKKLKDDSSVIG